MVLLPFGLHRTPTTLASLLIAVLAMTGSAQAQDDAPKQEAVTWMVAIHGGAGSWSREMPDADRESIEHALDAALAASGRILADGGSALDAVETAITILEDEPMFNSGRGAVFTRAGTHELDASIMDGATMRTGAVAGVKTVKNPIRAARLVMERTPHVLLTATGADEFAAANGCEIVGQEYFYTARMFRELEQIRADAGLEPLGEPAYGLPEAAADEPTSSEAGAKGTVGCVALDVSGHMAAGTSTGGLNGKLAGRVGDTPICGAGTFADAGYAVSCTGKGEEFIRHGIARRVAWLAAERPLPVDEAARVCLEEILRPGDGGIIAVDRSGAITMRATTEAMPRGVADSTGRLETAIWFD